MEKAGHSSEDLALSPFAAARCANEEKCDISSDLESRFYAVLSKAASSGLASNPRRSKSRGAENGQKAAKVFDKQKGSKCVLTPGRYIMNEFTDKNEQAFLDACGAIGVKPNATVNTQKERYLVSEFLKNPVSWLETERVFEKSRFCHISPTIFPHSSFQTAGANPGPCRES